MATIQKRIYELQTYVQLNPGDSGYIPATSVFLAVDYNGWSEAKKMTIDDFLGELHVEAGRLTNLASKSVSRSFGTAFTGTVIDNIKVYRESTELVAGKTIRDEVLYYDLSVTLSGFSLEIDDDESLTGIIVDYSVIEAQ